jgi:hypothetical protein
MSERWGPAEDAILRAEYHLSTSQKIGSALGRSAASVRARARYLKLDGTGRIGRSQHRKRWTEGEDAYLREHYVSETAEVIAKDLKRTTPSVQYRAKVLRLEAGRTRGRLWADHEESRLWQMWGNRPPEGIAEALGRTVSAVVERAKVMGLGALGSKRSNVWEVAAQNGYTPDQVQRSVSYLDLRARHGWHKDPETGQRTYRKKFRPSSLTEEQVSEILVFLKQFPDGLPG